MMFIVTNYMTFYVLVFFYTKFNKQEVAHLKFKLGRGNVFFFINLLPRLSAPQQPMHRLLFLIKCNHVFSVLI